MCRLTGYTREERLARDFSTLYGNKEEFSRACRAFVEVYNTGIPQKISHQYITKDGGTRHVESVVSLMRDEKDNPIGFRGISRDVTERLKMEQAQARYHNFIENIDDICFENDLRGTVTFFNNAMCKISNLSPEELHNTNYRQLYSEDTVARIYPVYNDIYRTGKKTTLYDFEMTRKDGETRLLDVTVGRMHDNEGKPIGFRGVAKDVTERKKAEEVLERYKEFVENIDDGCFEMDFRGRYTFVNDTMCRRSGYTREELFALVPGRRYADMEDRKRVYPIFGEVLKSGISRKIVYEYLKKNGEVYNIENAISLMRDPKGNPIGFRGISRDVTERFKMEREQERYRNFLDNIDDYCFESDLDGNLIFANEETLKLFGIKREQMQQGEINFRDCLSQKRADKYDQTYSDVYQTGTPAVLYDLEFTFLQGEKRYVDLSISLIRDDADKPAGFRMIARDVTKRKEMEDEQEKLKQKLSQSEKWEAIGTLAGGIAHDFNNLLMGIQGYTSLILFMSN